MRIISNNLYQRMNLRERITLILTTGLLIVLFVGVNAYRTDKRLVTINNWVVHTHLVLQKTQQVSTQLTSLDNDLRGHLQSDNPFFKADYDQNARQLTDLLKKLRELTIDSPVQQARLVALSRLMQTKFIRSKPLFTGGTINVGSARLDSIRNVLDLSDQFRLTLTDAETHEKELLVARNAESDRLANYATLSNGLGVLMALGLIAWAIYLLVRSLETSNQLNKKLKDSEQRIKNFLEAVPISVVVMDADGSFYYANKAATDMFGNTTDHFGTYANTLKEIRLYRSSDGQPYPLENRPIYRAMRGEATQIDDMEMRLAEHTIQIMTSASPVYDSEGALQYVVSSTVDISDRAHSEQRLQEAKELAEEAARLKENFLANMSHEIRTPLNAMLGFSTLLETTPLSAEQKEFVSSIRMAGKNLLTIVNDILDISKIEAGMLQFESIPFAIGSLAASIQTMFLSAAADKNLHLVVDTDPALPPTVLGDPTRLTQILLNLLSNALKFTKDGGVTVAIKKTAETDESVRVRFTVEDTGIGMAAEVLPHIFERFRQATDNTTRYYGGTGLGLNIVKNLTEMQGGWIAVDSTPGKGSRFTLEIPYRLAPEPVESTDGLADTLPGPDGRSLTILVVEDNLMNQKLAMQVLKRLGYTTLIAENGRKALDLLQTGQSIDVVLMDIQMPVMDGYETTRHIRNTLQRSIPIIAMTAHALASEREQCLQAGMNDFISKPFQMEELQRVLRKYLTLSAHAPVLSDAGPLVEPDESATPSKQAQLVDSLMNAVGNDTDLAAELLELFLVQTTGEIGTLQAAMSQGDVGVISRIVHTQKVPTQMFGLTDATRLILAIEALVASQKDITEVRPLVEQYIRVLNTELPLINHILQTIFNRVSNLEA